MRRALLAGAGALLLATGCAVAFRTGAPAQTDEAMPPNDVCYVCHIPFAEEALSVAHAQAKVGCRQCHGPSAGHMNDENIGATPPDRVYKASQVDRMCAKCHAARDHPKVAPAVRAARLAASTKAQSEVKGHSVEPAGICTDCHGTHWIPPKR